jgi:hypothetical protein
MHATIRFPWRPGARALTLLLPLVVVPAHPAGADLAPPASPFGEAGAPCDPALGSEGEWLFRTDSFARRGHSLVHDPVRDRLVIFGGAFQFNRGYQSFAYVSDETWIRPADLSRPWERLVTSGPTPTRRWCHGAVFDPAGDRMIVFGGYPGAMGDVWQLDFAADPPQWSELEPTGSTRPLPRYNHSTLFDPVRRRMLVFGGVAGTFSPLYDWANDVWELTLDGTPAWRRLLISSGYPRVEGAQSAYDSRRDRWILSGGLGRILSSGGEVFVTPRVLAIDLATMQAVRLPDLPRGTHSVWDHSISYDPARDRLLVFGGGEDFAVGTAALDLADPDAAWRMLASANPVPSTRVEHADWFDVRRNRLVISGGGHADLIARTEVLSFGRDIRATFGSKGPFQPRSHRPVDIVLHGSESLSVTELDPITIRIGQASVLARGSAPLFSLEDADGDGVVDAVVTVDSHDITGGSSSLAVDVRARTSVGELVCGELDLSGAGETISPGIEEPAAPGAGRANQPTLALDAGGAGLPSGRSVPLRVRIDAPGRFALELWSVGGRRLASVALEGPLDHTVDVRPPRGLAPGIYWARLTGTAGETVVRRVVVGR